MAKMKQMGRLALIALGSNEISVWGNATATVQKAMHLLEDFANSPFLQSRLFTTPAFPKGAGPDFINAAVGFVTQMSAPDLLLRLHEIEDAANRTRTHRWGQRTLDLDLIALGETVTPDREIHAYWRDLPVVQQKQRVPDQLLLPHPRLQDRSFVLVPLADIAPDWRHPLLGLTVRQMSATLPAEDLASVVPVK